MRSSKKSFHRDITSTDYRYNDENVAKLINLLMRDGKKQKATDIVYKAFGSARQKLLDNKVDCDSEIAIWNRSLSNVLPRLEVKSKRFGGATYSVPCPLKPKRATILALRWFVLCARSAKGSPMHDRLANEIVGAYEGVGAVIKKRDDIHKLADANRAFAQYG